eukprot:1763410-Pyramimonas_sp.AAC.1
MKRCTGCGGRMRYPPLGPSVELPMGPRRAALCVADACGTPTGAFGGAPYGATKRFTRCGRRMWYPHWGLTWSSLWGHEA